MKVSLIDVAKMQGGQAQVDLQPLQTSFISWEPQPNLHFLPRG